jgi:hypothetical protein
MQETMSDRMIVVVALTVLVAANDRAGEQAGVHTRWITARAAARTRKGMAS